MLDKDQQADVIKNFDFASDKILCKIADLGLAKILENDLANTVAGTRTLMAPEILRQEAYGHKADVWSIGCLFYQLLFGFLPFQGESQQLLIDAVMRGEYGIPKTVHLTKGCLDFLTNCLQYDPEKRHSW